MVVIFAVGRVILKSKARIVVLSELEKNNLSNKIVLAKPSTSEV